MARARHARDTSLSPTAQDKMIAFTIGLRMKHGGLDRFVDRTQDKSSPLFGRTLSPAAVGDRFGLSLRVVARLERLLAARGVTITATYPQRTQLAARATVGTLERLFDVRFRNRPGAAGAMYPVPSAPPTVPRALRPYVDGIIGLDTRPRELPHLLFPLRPSDVSIAYDVAALRRKLGPGAKPTIAVISFQDFSSKDFQLFLKENHRTGSEPKRCCAGFGAVTDRGVDEADLDAEVIRATAPNANIIFYEAPNKTAGELAMLGAFTAGPAAVGSYSWGFCDWQLPANDPYRKQLNKDLASAQAAGKTLFVASGDQGAYDCQAQDFADHRLTVDFPGDTTHVVSVGGTLLGVNDDGSYHGEDAWVEPLSDSGGGGGISPVEQKPSWQAGIVPGTRRGVPDVSAVASGGSPWLVEISRHQTTIAGTSAAAPFWAAAMALTEQYAHQHRVRMPCFLAPILYRLGSTAQTYPAFHDISFGTNRHYAAKHGWDYATGLGSPNVWNHRETSSPTFAPDPARVGVDAQRSADPRWDQSRSGDRRPRVSRG